MKDNWHSCLIDKKPFLYTKSGFTTTVAWGSSKGLVALIECWFNIKILLHFKRRQILEAVKQIIQHILGTT